MSAMGREKNVVVVDLDGTLALDEHRNHHLRKEPKDWDSYFAECGKDTPNEAIMEIVRAMYERKYGIFIVSGRRGDCRKVTESWLNEHYVPYHSLAMRNVDDRTDDHILKRQMVDAYFNKILFVIEDRQRVVDMWRSEGLICLQCAQGNF